MVHPECHSRTHFARTPTTHTGLVICLALLPPSFPNAAAHALALALVAAEIVLLAVNVTLLGLVHLAVLLNRVVVPQWFHRVSVLMSETSSGVTDHTGRSLAAAAAERLKLLADLESTTQASHITHDDGVMRCDYNINLFTFQ